MVKEYEIEKLDLKSQIKYLASLEGFSLAKLKEEVNKKYNKNDSVRNLGNKLRNKTFRVSELLEIADILGYEIVWKKK